MSKGKRYILVEVDVNLCCEGGDPNHSAELCDESQQSFDSLLGEIERLQYADGTGVFGAIKVHEHTQQPETLMVLHESACVKGPAPHYGSKECNAPNLHSGTKVLRHPPVCHKADCDHDVCLDVEPRLQHVPLPGLTEGVDY